MQSASKLTRSATKLKCILFWEYTWVRIGDGPACVYDNLKDTSAASVKANRNLSHIGDSQWTQPPMKNLYQRRPQTPQRPGGGEGREPQAQAVLQRSTTGTRGRGPGAPRAAPHPGKGGAASKRRPRPQPRRRGATRRPDPEREGERGGTTK